MINLSSATLLIVVTFLSLSIMPVSSHKTQQQVLAMWDDWLKIFNPQYISDPIEKTKRFDHFKNTIAKLDELNDPALGLNKFADLTDDEFIMFKGYSPQEGPIKQNSRSLQSESSQKTTSSKESSLIYPTTFDWRDYNVVTSVKQQNCGDCWAFSTAAFFESELVRRNLTNNDVDLAQQFFLQCDTISQGCMGGYLRSAMDLGLKQGIPYESQYKWNPDLKYSAICSPSNVVFIPDSFRVTKLYGISNDQIKQMLIRRPLNIAVASKNWNYYFPGSKRVHECPSISSNYSALDHTVLLVGWTETEWIIKNEWGLDWGIGGYIYVSNKDSEDCGIGQEVHTLDYVLPLPIELRSTSPIIVEEETTSCHLTNCQQCQPGSFTCELCKNGYQVNTFTKACIVQKIANCIEIKSWGGLYECLICKESYELKNGVCIDPVSTQKPSDNTVSIIDPSQNISQCPISNCSVCYDNGRKCLTCSTGYGLNQVTDQCQKSPIEGCNLFVMSRDVTNCFECKRGYTLVSNGSCKPSVK